MRSVSLFLHISGIGIESDYTYFDFFTFTLQHEFAEPGISHTAGLASDA